MESSKNRVVIRLKKYEERIRPVTFFAFLVIACMPFSTINVFGMGLLLLIGVPLLGLSVPTLLKCLRKTVWDKATVFLALFFAYGILAYVWAPDPSFGSIYNYT